MRQLTRNRGGDGPRFTQEHRRAGIACVTGLQEGGLVWQLVGGGVDQVSRDIEEALVAHWSYLGRWMRGALVDEEGVLRYETPIPHLPYNGVIRTRFTGGGSRPGDCRRA